METRDPIEEFVVNKSCVFEGGVECWFEVRIDLLGLRDTKGVFRPRRLGHRSEMIGT